MGSYIFIPLQRKSHAIKIHLSLSLALSIGKEIKEKSSDDSGSYISIECKYKRSFIQI